MNQRVPFRAAAFLALALAAAGLLLAPAAAARAPAAADDTAATTGAPAPAVLPADPAGAAVAYLEARAAAAASARQADILAPWVMPGSALAAREALVARGLALRQADLGHLVDDVGCVVSVSDATVDPLTNVATVTAHVVTTISWHAQRGGASVEASGVEHRLTLAVADGAWRVAADAYTDDLAPALLERAGAPLARVRAAERRLEAAAAAARRVWRAAAGNGRSVTPDAPPVSGSPVLKGYRDIISYDREAARVYADRYALSYNPTSVRFTAACANFVSQSTRAGDMPRAYGGSTSGWWYDKNRTSSPSDDSWSWSWISCSRQIAFWLGTRIDWVSRIADVGKGDVIYYDWTGDGSWDHVAILVGTNSAGQKVVDAHTTDHYHVYWKLGGSSTRYRFGRVRNAWVV